LFFPFVTAWSVGRTKERAWRSCGVVRETVCRKEEEEEEEEEEEDAGARRGGTKALPVWTDAARATSSATARIAGVVLLSLWMCEGRGQGGGRVRRAREGGSRGSQPRTTTHLDVRVFIDGEARRDKCCVTTAAAVAAGQTNEA